MGSLAANGFTKLSVILCAFIALSSNAFSDNERKAIVERNSKINQEIAEAVKRYAAVSTVPPDLMSAVIWQESRYDPNATNKKSTACGLGQLLKGTRDELNVSDCYDIAQNVDGATHRLANLLKLYADSGDRERLSVAAYYAGEGCIKRSRDKKNRMTCNFDDNKITYTPCVHATWFECLSSDTSTYVNLVYVIYRPVTKAFIDWDALQAKVEERKYA